MTDQTNAQSEAADDETVVVHLDVTATDEVQLRTVLIGANIPTHILLALEPKDGADEGLAITATIPGVLADSLESVDLLNVVAESFHRAIEEARPLMVERLIQPTPPADQVPLDGLDDRP